jgi:hypothetical protein
LQRYLATSTHGRSVVVQHILSKTELAFINGTRPFTKTQALCIKYRLNKKLKTLSVELAGLGVSGLRDAASEKRDAWSSVVKILADCAVNEREREK